MSNEAALDATAQTGNRMLHHLISVSDTPKTYPFATWESWRNLLRCPHRCQFALAETHSGCINRSRWRSQLARRGGNVLSRKQYLFNPTDQAYAEAP